MIIPFNIPCSTGEEAGHMQQALAMGQIAGNGYYTRLGQSLLKDRFGFEHTFFTPSGTAALEMAALLCNLQQGAEVIIPSFTHVSTANAFIRTGATVVFGDCLPGSPNLDPSSVIPLINSRTKVIVIVHYAGIACDMEAFRAVADQYQLYLVEDAAHAIGARYKDQWLGSLGDFAAFSFHETKNINCGQGGLLVMNRPELVERAREIWHHGTNRDKFEKGEIPCYTWVAAGGAFLMAELNAAFLYPQLSKVQAINKKRLMRWKQYYRALQPLQDSGLFQLPVVPWYAEHNAHIFYLLARTPALRDQLLHYLREHDIHAVFHYMPLHSSPYAMNHLSVEPKANAENIAACILRLPLYDSISVTEINSICRCILECVDALVLEEPSIEG